MMDIVDAFYDGTKDQLEVRRLITTGVQLFLYGMYIPLFGVCIHMIRKRKRGNYKLHITLTTVLFILCTITVILNLVNVAEAVKMEMPRYLAMLGVYMLANVCADLIMLHRCYVIWGGSTMVIIIPSVGLVINLAFGISVIGYQSTYLVLFLIMTFIENVILTGLTAGRIWWINHRAGAILGSAVQTRYRMIAAMIMESSILYSVAIIAGVVSMYAHNILASEIAVNAQTQLVGIAPTLLVVRVGLGVDMKDVVNSVNIMSMVHSRDLEDQSTEISEEDLDLESEEVPTAIMETWTTNRSGDLTAVGSSLLRPEMSKETGYLKSQIFYPQK